MKLKIVSIFTGGPYCYKINHFWRWN